MYCKGGCARHFLTLSLLMSSVSKLQRRKQHKKKREDVAILDLDEAILLAQRTDTDVVVQTAQIFAIHETRGGNMGYSVAYSHQPEVLQENMSQSEGGNADTVFSEATFIEPELLVDDRTLEETVEEEATGEVELVQEGKSCRRRKRVCIYLLLF